MKMLLKLMINYKLKINNRINQIYNNKRMKNKMKQKNLYKILKNRFNKMLILKNNKILNHIRIKIKFNNKMI